MMTEREKYNVAALTVQLLEQRVSQLVAARRAQLAEVVSIDSRNQMYWYGSDENGYIPILQDAAFVCTGVHVIGQELNGLEFWISVENLWVPRQATQNSYLPVELDNTANMRTQQSFSIPVDHFLPAYTQGNTVTLYAPNVDYWYTPSASWLIERGDTVRCLFKDNASDVKPLVVLSGYKVL